LETRDWQILKVLSEESNITRTAEVIGISQPALTKRLQLIESQLGIKIVHRGRKGVHFTPQGEYLAKWADKILVRIREMQDHIANMSDSISGTLRIGASTFFTRYQLPSILKQFKDLYPNVEFKVMSGWSHDIYSLIHNRDVHVAFLRGEYTWHEKKHLLLKETLYIVSRDPVSLEELPMIPRIDYQSDRKLLAMINNWWAENYTQPPLVGMVVDKTNTCKEMVKKGLGYAILPGNVLGEMKPYIRKEIRDPSGRPVTRDTWMLSRWADMNLQLVKTFVDFVEGLELDI